MTIEVHHNTHPAAMASQRETGRDRAKLVLMDPANAGLTRAEVGRLARCSVCIVSLASRELRAAGHEIPRCLGPVDAKRRVEAVLLAPGGGELTIHEVARRARCLPQTARRTRRRLVARGHAFPEPKTGRPRLPAVDRPDAVMRRRGDYAGMRAFLETPEALDLSEHQIGVRFGVGTTAVLKGWRDLFAAREAAGAVVAPAAFAPEPDDDGEDADRLREFYAEQERRRAAS